jgi:hypothetical protein
MFAADIIIAFLIIVCMFVRSVGEWWRRAVAVEARSTTKHKVVVVGGGPLHCGPNHFFLHIGFGAISNVTFTDERNSFSS